MIKLTTTQELKETPVNEMEILKEYLEDYLINFTNYYNPNRRYANKILCRNPNHQEKRPSMSLHPNKKYLHCFSCNATYSIIDLVIMDYELGGIDRPLEERLKDTKIIALACDKIRELFNITSKDDLKPKANYKPQPKENLPFKMLDSLTLTDEVINYFSKRGINDIKLLGTLNIKGDYQEQYKRLYIPYQIKGDIYTYTDRVINRDDLPKEMRYKHNGPMITYDPFNYLDNISPRIIFITEGEIDTISIYQTLGELKKEGITSNYKIGSVALGGINNNKHLLKQLKEINRNDLYLVLALDNDSRGREATRTLADYFYNNDINFTSFNILPHEVKDTNELLLKDKELLKERIKEVSNNILMLCSSEREKYNKELEQETKRNIENYYNEKSITSYLNTFKNNVLNPTRPIRTYFNSLDQVLKGGIREGLITIGAISSLGKTTLINQLTDFIAMSRQKDILYYSLEMSKDELIAKSLSRLMYINCNNRTQLVKSQADILNPVNWDNETELLYALALSDYMTYANKIFIEEGVYNLGVKHIRERAYEHREKTGLSPVIIIDYLQILASDDSKKGLSDKQKTDDNILQLKQLSRELHTPIIIISSLNRNSYNDNVSLSSFKESGAIEYTSDIVLGLNYALTEAQEQELKEVRLSSKGLNDEEKNIKLDDFYKKVRSTTPRNIRLDILKNRSGENNKTIEMKFYPQFNFFDNDLKTLETSKKLIEYSRKEFNKN